MTHRIDHCIVVYVYEPRLKETARFALRRGQSINQAATEVAIAMNVREPRVQYGLGNESRTCFPLDTTDALEDGQTYRLLSFENVTTVDG